MGFLLINLVMLVVHGSDPLSSEAVDPAIAYWVSSVYSGALWSSVVSGGLSGGT